MSARKRGPACGDRTSEGGRGADPMTLEATKPDGGAA